jgi:sulfoxide reductase catalytic subunit YedY
MPIRTPRPWDIPESAVTPEAIALAGGKLTRRAALGGSIALAAAGRAAPAHADAGAAPRNPEFIPGRALTPEKEAENYNNYYEFSESKYLAKLAQSLPLSPWSIEITGMVDKPRTIAFEDLMKQVQLEERIYRHRCVEAWAMTVPWTGFPMKQLVALAAPQASAKYVVFTTLQDDKHMPGLAEFYPWPYVEGVTIEEANNDLAFMSTGLYGKPLPPQNGGPLRVTLPWKYGFKSIKAIVKVDFTDKRPATMWAQILPREYGFWANVNPAVPHPRWSQASERLLGTGEIVPTQIYNGYGDQVAGLYTGLANEKLFM